MADKKKKKKETLWSQMNKVTSTKTKNNPLQNKRDYTNYRVSGGSSDFGTWKKENNR